MPDPNTQSSFRNIMKGTALFGGTQVFTTGINLVKGKLVAAILGAMGMGISSHLSSTLSPIQQFFSFGLTTSAVKSISATTNEQERSALMKSLRRLMLLLALIAMSATAGCSVWLSMLTFQTPSHWPWFVMLGIAVFFLMLSSGETAILQGMRALKALAICNFVSPLSGLFISVPLYWVWGIEGIAPAMMALGLISWVTARHFTWRIHLVPVPQSWRTTLSLGRDMLTLGFTIMVGGVIGSLAIYAVNTFIAHYGTESDLGLYQAASIITVQCATLVFTAMGTDFFPHLSSLIHQRHRATLLIGQQGEIVLLLIVPVSLVLITLAPIAVRVLLTSEFTPITFLLRAMSVSLLSRAICYPLDYICIAKGDHTYFFLIECVWTNIKTVTLTIVGYTLGGIDGIAIGFLIGVPIEIAVSILFNRWRYGIGYTSSYYRLAGFLTAALLGCFAASFIPSPPVAYTLMALISLATCAYAYQQIDQRINIRNLIQQKTHARSQRSRGSL